MLKESIAIARHSPLKSHIGDGIKGFAHATPDALPPPKVPRYQRHRPAAKRLVPPLACDVTATEPP